MAVRTDQITFSYFFENCIKAIAGAYHCSNCHMLLVRIAMIKLHHIWRIFDTTILARNIFEFVDDFF
jgi:hypothetical protein